jgi:hypothetical protein
MWAEACALIERAERLQRQFFRPSLAGAITPYGSHPSTFTRPSGSSAPSPRFPVSSSAILRFRSRGDVLLIAGTRRFPTLSGDAVIHRLEIPHGRFERRIRISASRLRIDRSELLNGCLFLILVKNSEAG